MRSRHVSSDIGFPMTRVPTRRQAFRRTGPALLVAVGLLAVGVSGAAEAREPAGSDAEVPPDTVSVASWLVLGPVATPPPAFHDADERGFDAADLLAASTLEIEVPWPEAGATVPGPDGDPLRWSERSPASGDVRLDRPRSDLGQAWLAAYVEVDRFTDAELVVETGAPVRVSLDGEQVAERTAAGDQPVTASLALTPGAHLLAVETVVGPADGGEGASDAGEADEGGPPDGWRIRAGLVPEDTAAAVRLSTDPRRAVRVADLLDTETVSEVRVSPDGRHVALTFRRPAAPAEGGETWLEVRRTADGAVVRSFRGVGDVSGFRWGPDAGTFAFTSREDERGTLWRGRLEGGVEPVVRGVEGLGSFRWMPDGEGFVYAVEVEEEEAREEAERLRGLPDRWAGWRDRSYLWRVDADGGARRRLTAGVETTALHDVSPDGERLIFTRSRFVPERPYTETELWELELATLEATELATYAWGGGAAYGPRGERVLLTAGPSAFDGAGSVLPDSVIPNDYDTQAYLLHRADGRIEPLTRDFAPAVSDAFWTGGTGGDVILVAQDSAYRRLFRLDAATGTTERIATGAEVLGAVDVARDGSVALYTGSGPGRPPRVRIASLTGAFEPRTLTVPGEERWSRVVQPRVEDWSFEAEGGRITGRLYYPPGFDRDGTYPLIVYYYGGTLPTARSFGGRYPKELWAGLGYAVFVPQPSGAIGFGQAFSARHVNDWGERVAAEVIAGTEALLSEKPFLDRERVGCIGASYGGFLTMQLLTKTDLFAGCVAHAGISSISSYWGEGWWGYLYSAVATAGSYPWNRPDLYVERSPLFRADEITTPLLLLHGTEDTNVPPGESEQLYAALEVLDREVEYVRIQGANHGVVRYPERELWTETILAWFERTLKDRDGWWAHLWPEAE